MTITYTLTANAHRAAVLAGRPGPAQRTVSGAVDPAAAAAVADRLLVADDGTVTVSGLVSRDTGSTAELLDVLREEAAAEQAEYEAYVAACLEVSDDEAWYDANGDWRHASGVPIPSPRFDARASDDPRIQAKRREVDARRQPIRAAREARASARRRAREAAAAEARRQQEAAAAAERRRQEAAEADRRAHIARKLQEIVPDVVGVWRAGELCTASAISAIADHVLNPLVGEAADTALCRSPRCKCHWRPSDCLPIDVARRKAHMLADLPKGSKITNVRFGFAHSEVVEAKRDGRTPQGVWIATVQVPDGSLTLERDVKL